MYHEQLKRIFFLFVISSYISLFVFFSIHWLIVDMLLTDCMAELRRVKPVAERCEATEGRMQQVESQAEALQEMVANLTEGKVALTTKVGTPSGMDYE